MPTIKGVMNCHGREKMSKDKTKKEAATVQI